MCQLRVEWRLKSRESSKLCSKKSWFPSRIMVGKSGLCNESAVAFTCWNICCGSSKAPLFRNVCSMSTHTKNIDDFLTTKYHQNLSGVKQFVEYKQLWDIMIHRFSNTKLSVGTTVYQIETLTWLFLSFKMKMYFRFQVSFEISVLWKYFCYWYLFQKPIFCSTKKHCLQEIKEEFCLLQVVTSLIMLS